MCDMCISTFFAKTTGEYNLELAILNLIHGSIAHVAREEKIRLFWKPIYPYFLEYRQKWYHHLKEHDKLRLRKCLECWIRMKEMDTVMKWPYHLPVPWYGGVEFRSHVPLFLLAKAFSMATRCRSKGKVNSMILPS